MAIAPYDVVLLFANLAKSTLAGAITNTAVTAQLQTGTGALYPGPTSGQGYVATFVDAATGLLNEVVLVTQMTGDQITTMVRAQEGTGALAWNAGDFFYMLDTAGTMASMQQTQQAAPARVITSSASFTASNLDGGLGFARVSGLAATTVTLPVSPTNGQVIEIDDLVGNFNTYPITVTPNSGQNIVGLPGSATLNVNGGSWQLKFYSTGTNLGTWSLLQ